MKKILFATTVFDEVENGPGTYARYLWDAFQYDPELEFHLIAPKSRIKHPRIHEAGSPYGSLNLYQAVQNKIASLQRTKGPFELLHANSAHMLGGFDTTTMPIIAQVNDYEVAESFVRPLATIKEKGFKRALSLAWRRYHEERILSACDMVITNSDYVRHKIHKHYELDNSVCRTVYKAVDLASFKRIEDNDIALASGGKPNQGLSREPHLIFIGSNWEIKGLDFLLAALRMLVDKGTVLKLSVVGDGAHPRNKTIRKQYQDLEATGVVHYLGCKTRFEIPPLLWQADLSILPSRQEALGVSILESMAAGVPVIASKVGGIPEILAEGEYGMDCEVGKPTDLASCIEAMLASESLRAHYIAAGLERVEKFSRISMIDKIRQIYLEIDTGGGIGHCQRPTIEMPCN